MSWRGTPPRPRLSRRGLWRTGATALALASLSLATATPALGGPKGGVVKGGQASISTRSGVTTIRQGTQKVVIDWRSFDIDADEAVRFVQPDQGSIALNRVLDGMPTHIRGQLLANGNVWLVNPSGVMFHAGSVVDVGGLLATTADIENEAFMRGDFVFDKPGDPDARIVNEGRITFRDAGLAGFVAPEVVNRGEIAGRVGKIVIAGHERFSVDVSGDGMFELDLGPTGPEGGGRAANLGRLAAEGGTIVLSAAAVRGAVEAAVHAGGVIEARSARVDGGAIILDGGEGRVEVTGSLDVSGAAGGDVRIEGAEIAVRAGATIDASGESGGGRVRIGGGRAGAGPAEGGLKPADRLEVEQGAFVTVSADRIGDGGEAIFWSEDATFFAGRVEGRGGAEGGDGAFVEISSRLDLAFAGEVDLSAPLGAVGQVLFDPRDIVIVADGSGEDISGDVPAGQDPGDDLTVNASSLAEITADVTLQATRDILFASGVALLNIRSNAITFEAGRDIVLNGSRFVGANLTFVAGATLAGQPGDPQGAVRVSGSPQITALQTLSLSAPQGILGGAMTAADTLTLRSRTSFSAPAVDMPGAFNVISTAGTLSLGDVTAAGLEATGEAGIALTGVLDIAGAASFSSPGEAFSLTGADNRFGGPVSVDTAGALLSPQTVTIDVAQDLELGDVTADALDVKAGGALTGVGLIFAEGNARFEAPSISLTGADSIFGATLSLAGDGAATVASGQAVRLGDLALASLDLGAGGPVDDASAGATSIAGNLSVATSGGEITLQRSGASIGGAISAVTTLQGAGPARVEITRAGSLMLGDVAAGVLDLVVGADVSQSGSGVVNVIDLDVAAGGDVVLSNASNTVGGVVDATARSLSLAAAGDATLGEVDVDALSIGIGGALTQTLSGQVRVSGDVDVSTAGGAVDLGNAANLLGGEISVATDALGNSVADVTVHAGAGPAALGVVSADAFNLDAGGDVSQTGAVSAASIRVTTAGGTVDLSNGANDLAAASVDTTGGGSAAAADVSLSSAGDLELGDLLAASLEARAGGALSQTPAGVLDVAGTSDFIAEGGAIDVSNENRFGGAVSADADGGAAHVALGDADALLLGPIKAGSLAVVASDLVSQTFDGTVDVGGTTTVSTRGGDVSLDRTGNRFGGPVAVDTTDGGAARAAVSLAAAEAIQLGAITASSLSVDAGGAVSDTVGGPMDVDGDASFATAGGALSLVDDPGHLFGGSIRLDVGEASIATAAGLTVGGTATSLETISSDFETSGPLVIGGGAGTLTVRAVEGIDLALGGAGAGFDVSQGSLDSISAGESLFSAAGTGRVAVRGGAFLLGLGDVRLTSEQGVTFEAGAAEFAETLVVTSGGGIDGPAADITVGELLTLDAAGDVALTGANVFSGGATASAAGRNVALTSATDLPLGDVLAGSLEITAAGDIEAAGVLTVDGDAVLSAFDSLGDGDAATGVLGDVTALAAGNAIGGALSVTGDAVDVAVDGDLTLEDVYARTSLSAAAGGAAGLARIAVGPGVASGDSLSLPPGGALAVSAGGAITAADVQAGDAGFGGAGTTSTAAAAGAAAISLERMAVANLSTGETAGAMDASDIDAIADVDIGGAATVSLSRIEAGGTVKASSRGSAFLGSVRAARVEASGSDVSVGFLEAGSAALVASAGDVTASAAFADPADADGRMTLVAPPLRPLNDAGDEPLVQEGVVSVGPYASLVSVADDLEAVASGAIALEGGEVGGTFRGIELGSLTADAGGDLTVSVESDLVFGTTSVGGRLEAASSGSISQTGLLDVGGSARFEAAGSVVLPEEMNEFAEAVSLEAVVADIVSAGPLGIIDSALGDALTARALSGAVPVVINGRAGSASLILEQIDVAGAGTLIGAGASGVAGTNIAALDATLGGTGTDSGAATETAGDVLLHRLAVETLTAAAAGEIHVSEAVIDGALATAGAARASLDRVTFGPGAVASFDGVDDSLILQRVHSQGDLTAEVSGDILLGLVRASAAGAETGTLSLTSRGGAILKLADVDIDYLGDGDGTLALDLGSAGKRTIAAAGSGAFDDLVQVDGDLVVSAFEDVVLTEGAALDGPRRLSVGGSAVFLAGGDLAATAEGALDLAPTTVGRDALLRITDRSAAGDGDLTQSGPLSVAGGLTLETSGDARLSMDSNALTEVSGDVAGAAVFRDADGFAVRDLRAASLAVADQSGAVALADVGTATSLSIEADALEAARVSAATLTLEATAGDLSLTDAQAGETRLIADGALTAARFALGGFSAVSGGDLRLSDGQGGDSLPGGVSADGDLDLSGLRLGDSSMAAGGSARLEAIRAGSIIVEVQGGALEIADVETAGAFAASASGAITSVARSAGAGDATTVEGPRAASLGEAVGPRLGDPVDARETFDLASVADAELSAVGVSPGLVVGGDAGLRAGGGVDLPQGTAPDGATNRFFGDVALDVTGDAVVEAAGAVILAQGQVTGDLDLRSNADGTDRTGNAGVTQSGAVSVAGRATIVTGAPADGPEPATLADVVLENAGNAFSEIEVDARSARLGDADGFVVRDSVLARDLVIGNGVAQTGSVTLTDVAAASVSADVVGDVDADRVSVTGNAAVTAGGDLAGAALDIGTADFDVGGRTSISGSEIGQATIVGGGDVDVSAYSGDVLAATSGGTIGLTDATVSDIDAAADADARFLRVEAAEANVDAGQDVLIEASSVGVGMLDAGRDVFAADLDGDALTSASGGDTALTRVALSGALVSSAGGATELTDVSAGSLEISSSGDLSVSRAAARGDGRFFIGGDADIENLSARNGLVEAEGGASIDRVRFDADGAFLIGEGLSVANLDVGADLDVDVGEGFDGDRILVGGDADLRSGDAMTASRLSTAGALTAAADLDETAAGNAAALLRQISVESLTLEAGGAADIDAASVAADAAILTRRGDVRLGAVDIGGDGAFQAKTGAIRSREGTRRVDGFAVNSPLEPEPPEGAAAGGEGGSSSTRRQVLGRVFETLVTIGGDAWFDAAGDVLLPGGGTLENDFRGGVTVSRGARVALSDGNDLTIGAPDTTLPDGGETTGPGIYDRVEGETIAALRIEVGGSLLDAPGARIRVNGDAWLQAGRDVELDTGRHDVGGSVGAQGRDVTLRMRDDVRLGPVRAARDFTLQANARDAAGSGFIRQTSSTTTPELIMQDGVAAGGDRQDAGPIEVGGVTDISTGAPDDRLLEDLNGRGEVRLDDRRNRFDGSVALRRIFGDVVLVEEATEGLAARDAADGDELRLRNLDAAGDVLISTSDDVIFIGRLTSLLDGDKPSSRPSIPTSETPAERRAQGRADLADDALRLYIADGRRLKIDTTAGGVDAAGGDIRFDRPVDGANDAIGQRTTASVGSRKDFGRILIDAGRKGHVRLRDFVGAGHPIGRFTIEDGGDVSLGHTFADRTPGENTRDARFLLGRGDDERDVLFASTIAIDARGRVEIYVDDVTFELYDDADDFFGVNTLGLRFGDNILPETLTLFGFITDSGKRAAGVYAEGPEVDDQTRFQFNGCNAGDVVDCARLTQPSVLEIVRIDQAQILNVDEEDLLELFVSYGNEELWGVPPGYFLDIDVSAARASGNQQAVQPPVSNVVTTTGGAGATAGSTPQVERADR